MKLSRTTLVIFLVGVATGGTLFPQETPEQKSSDDEFHMSVALLDPEWILKLGAADGDSPEMVEKIGNVGAAVEKEVAALSRKDQAVVVRLTLKKDDANVEVFSFPEIPEAEIAPVKAKIEAIETPSMLKDTFRLQFQFIQGSPPDPPGADTWPPGSETRGVMRAREFEKLDIAGKSLFLQNWARNEILPVLGIYQRSADPKFEGVVKMGKLLGEADYTQLFNVPELIDSNDDYWRGVLEMSPGNPLVSATRIFMEAANGNHDEAMQFASMRLPFLDREAVPSRFIGEYVTLYSSLREDVNATILTAIEKFDAGDPQSAATICESLLKAYPRSAWARYELWFSRNQIKEDTGNAPEGYQPWSEVKNEIYSMDCLYPMAVEATTEREAYELYRRLELKDMKPPQNGEEFIQSFLKRADIAFDLHEYHFSAEAYWTAVSSIKPETYNNRPLVQFSLFSIASLGAKGIAEKVGQNFKEIERIANEHQTARYLESPVYETFRGGTPPVEPASPEKPGE